MQACRQAVIGSLARPEFARILEGGNIHATQRGYYVDDIVLGEMGERGSEVRSRYTCYIDAKGNVVNTQRQP